jgi:hypothetical protein
MKTEEDSIKDIGWIRPMTLGDLGELMEWK